MEETTTTATVLQATPPASSGRTDAPPAAAGVEARMGSLETAVGALTAAVTAMQGQMRWRSLALSMSGYLIAAVGAAVAHGGNVPAMLQAFLQALGTAVAAGAGPGGP